MRNPSGQALLQTQGYQQRAQRIFAKVKSNCFSFRENLTTYALNSVPEDILQLDLRSLLHLFATNVAMSHTMECDFFAKLLGKGVQGSKKKRGTLDLIRTTL
jgi:hypothetical protein